MRAEVQRLLRSHKRGRDLSASVTHKQGRKGMKDEYSSELKELLAEDPNLKPMIRLRFFRMHFDRTTRFKSISEQQVLSKIASVKQVIKKDKIC